MVHLLTLVWLGLPLILSLSPGWSLHLSFKMAQLFSTQFVTGRRGGLVWNLQQLMAHKQTSLVVRFENPCGLPFIFLVTTCADGGSQRFPTHEEALLRSSPAALSSPPVSVVNTSQVGPLELISLTPSTRYAVQISAWNSVGEGPKSQVMVIETLPSSTSKLTLQHTHTCAHTVYMNLLY